jgi:hypothetical protein
MKDDAVITEVRRVRTALSAKYGNDVHKLAAALRERQKAGGVKAVSFAKSPRKANATSKSGPASRKPLRAK